MKTQALVDNGERIACVTHFAAPTGWKIVVPISPAAFANDASSSPTDRAEIFLRMIGCERVLFHQAPRDANGVGGNLTVVRRCTDNSCDGGSLIRCIGLDWMVPRELLGCRWRW